MVKWLSTGGKETGLLMDLGEVEKADGVDGVQLINMQSAHAALLQQ